MTLAYMAEISVVFNLAYMELRSARYLKNAAKTVQAVRTALEDAKEHIPTGSTQEEKTERAFRTKLDDLFSYDTEKRVAAWRTGDVTNDRLKTRKFGLSSRWIFPMFRPISDGINLEDVLFAAKTNETLEYNSWDKRVCSAFLLATVCILIACTVLSQIGVNLGPECCESNFVSITWWFFFIMLLAGILAPAIFVKIGRKLAGDAEKISVDMTQQFESSSKVSFDAKTEKALTAPRPKKPLK